MSNKRGNMTKEQRAKKIEILINEFISEGWNKNQAKSLAWAEYFDDYIATYEQNHNGYSCNLRIDCYCDDCKEGANLLPSTVRDFLAVHLNHKTRTIKR